MLYISVPLEFLYVLLSLFCESSHALCIMVGLDPYCSGALLPFQCDIHTAVAGMLFIFAPFPPRDALLLLCLCVSIWWEGACMTTHWKKMSDNAFSSFLV